MGIRAMNYANLFINAFFMHTLQTELGLVKNRFPSHKMMIEDLYRRDTDFKSLCADLFLCSRMIQDFETEIADKQHALTEYREIVKELETELENLIRCSAAEK